jgi:hypothetical protein
MAYQTEIERALDEMVAKQEWLKFQRLAVILAQQKWPHLVASEPNWDGGLDAHASGYLDATGSGSGLACSLTTTLEKVESDAAKVKENYPDVRVLIFATPGPVTKHTEAIWAAEILAKFGLQLVVVPRAQFIAWLQEPANAGICKEQFAIAPSMAPELEPALDRALDAANKVADNWDHEFRRAGRPVISLNAVKLNEKGDPVAAVATASLLTVLSEGERIILEAPAGSGKTTTLVQLARQAIDAGRQAFLVDLPDWVRSGKSVFPISQTVLNSPRENWTRRCSQNCEGPNPRSSCSMDGTKFPSSARKRRTWRCVSLIGVLVLRLWSLPRAGIVSSLNYAALFDWR